MPNGTAEAAGMGMMGSYVTTTNNAPTTVRECVEVPNTTGRSWDLGYMCGSNTVSTAAQLMPYERQGYVKCSKEIARTSYGLNVANTTYFTAFGSSPVTDNLCYLVSFIGQPDDAATDIMPRQVVCELRMYVEFVQVATPAASDV